jgi:hypothetical protein
MIPDKALKEFKQIWEEEFNQGIPDDVALEKAINLLTFFKNIYRPIKKEWIEVDKKL